MENQMKFPEMEAEFNKRIAKARDQAIANIKRYCNESIRSERHTSHGCRIDSPRILQAAL